MATSQGDSSEAAELPFSSAAARLIVDARHEAARLKHAHVGTEHLMLALSHQSGDAAPLDAFAIDRQRAHGAMEAIVSNGNAPTSGDFALDLERESTRAVERPFTLRARRAIAAATESARRVDRSHIGVADVLVGVMADRDSVAAQLLANLGVTLARAESYAREAANEV